MGLGFIWFRRASSTVRLDPSSTCLPPLNLLGLFSGYSWDFAAVSVYHQGHRLVYRPGSYDPIPMDRLAYGVMMNGDSNSSAETRVTVRVP